MSAELDVYYDSAPSQLANSVTLDVEERDVDDDDKLERTSSIGAYYDNYDKQAKQSVLSSMLSSSEYSAGADVDINLQPADRKLVTLSWQKICAVTVPKKKRFGGKQAEAKDILKDVSGIVKPGELMALMGASGAGKSTLLNALLGHNTAALRLSGDVYVNGARRRPGGKMVACVQQEDLFIGALTVGEHLVFQALLRLPSSMAFGAKRARAHAVARRLGLRKCLHTAIGLPGITTGISGGERKRLSLATELLADPPLIICDEPTSGLDSYRAETVVLHLQQLANEGKTVLCTIHQPASEIYALFDKVTFVADGRLAFSGSKEEAMRFFADSLVSKCPVDYNPADYFIEQLATRAGDAQSLQRVHGLCEAFAQSEYGKKVMSEVAESISTDSAHSSADDSLDNSAQLDMRSYATGAPTQFAAILWRSTVYNYRNPVVALSRMFQCSVMGVLIALMFSSTDPASIDQAAVQNVKGATFFIVLNLTTMAMMSVLRLVPAEHPILVREHHKHLYSVYAWYVAKAMSVVPVFTVNGVLMIAICYFPIGLRPEFGAFMIALLIGAVSGQMGAAFGNMMASVCPSFIMALAIIGPVSQLMSQTSGLFANLAQLPPWLSWFQYVSFRRFGYEAITINQWSHLGNLTCGPADYSCVRTGDEVLAQLGFTFASPWYDIVILLGFIVAFHTVGYGGLLARVIRAK